MILLILQYAKLLFYTSDTVNSKLLNPLPEDPKPILRLRKKSED